MVGPPSILSSAERVSLLGLAPARLLVGDISRSSLASLLLDLAWPGLCPAHEAGSPDACLFVQSVLSSCELPAVAATEVATVLFIAWVGRLALTLVTASLPWSPFCCGMAS